MKRITTILLAVLSFLTASAQKNGERMEKVIEHEIVVNLYYTGKNGSARKFVEEMEASGTAKAIREEKGNLRYEYFFPAATPETVLLIDSWKNQAAIDAHHASPMMKTIAELRDKYEYFVMVPRKDHFDVERTDRNDVRAAIDFSGNSATITVFYQEHEVWSKSEDDLDAVPSLVDEMLKKEYDYIADQY